MATAKNAKPAAKKATPVTKQYAIYQLIGVPNTIPNPSTISGFVDQNQLLKSKGAALKWIRNFGQAKFFYVILEVYQN
jgi:hypothetical protein